MDLDRIGQRGHLASSQCATLFPRVSPECTLQWASSLPSLCHMLTEEASPPRLFLTERLALKSLSVDLESYYPAALSRRLSAPLHEDALCDGSLFTAEGEFEF